MKLHAGLPQGTRVPPRWSKDRPRGRAMLLTPLAEVLQVSMVVVVEQVAVLDLAHATTANSAATSCSTVQS